MLERLIVKPGEPANLAGRDPRDTLGGVPTETELEHDFLWRIHANCPARGEIGIFNRSHYEDVVTVGVMELSPEDVWRPRIGQIREFERELTEEGTTIVKCYLHISREEQKQRLEARLANPEKRWKFNPGDLETRRRWDGFAAAYEEALTATSTELAPWYVVPADRMWVRNLAIAHLLVEALRRLDPQLPEPGIRRGDDRVAATIGR
jgi:PPK2 family polyphosphate:nucleotide phosphotransferase